MARTVRTPAKKACNRCGSTTVAWEKNDRGKWYLIELFIDPFGDPDRPRQIGDRVDFHSSYCNKPDEHKRVQDEINAEAEGDAEIRKQRDEREQAEREHAEVEMMAAFLHMGSTERRDELQRRRDEIQREMKNDPTMDYFTDQIRWRAKLDSMRYELDLLEDFMAELDD
jgi:hypothetical protein